MSKKEPFKHSRGHLLQTLCMSLILCTIFSASAQAIDKRPHGTEYDYDTVCKFIDSQLSIAENRIHMDANQHVVLLSVAGRDGSIRKYRYRDKGTSVEYIETQSKKIIIWASFAADTFPKSMRSRDSLMSKFGVKNPGGLTDAVSLECDATTMQLNFNGKGLRDVTFTADFID